MGLNFCTTPYFNCACRSLLMENNGRNNSTAVGLHAFLLFSGGETKDYLRLKYGAIPRQRTTFS